jgi:hypothetical protein
VDKIGIILQTLNPTKLELAKPHDSTIGVGSGFMWFAGAVVLVLVVGTVKAFSEDKGWRGRVIKRDRKYRSGQWTTGA